MSKLNDSDQVMARKPFVKPELQVLDIKETETGPFPDPFEFPMILQMS